MTTVVTRGPAVLRPPADHLATARRYAADPDAWPFAPRFDLRRRWYRRLAGSPDVEVWLLSWLPGQGTELHDHGDSSGAFVVVSGALTEDTVTAGPDTASPRLRRRTLRARDGRAFDAAHIHQITNTATRPAVSVHVYGPALHEMHRYRLHGGQLQRIAVDRAGADW
jgi:hypothetical protein